jgi:diadenylate cyclase
MFSDRIQSLWHRLNSYNPVEVAIELLLIGVVVYSIVRFVRGTRAAGALKALFFILVIATLIARVAGGGETFRRLAFLYDRFLALVTIGLLVIFQPELRRALIRLGESPFFRFNSGEIATAVDAIADACAYLSRARFGAIIVIERQTELGALVEGGTVLGAELTARLLQTIFFPGTALHDLAVVVKGNVIHAAGVQLPLAEPSEMPDPTLGSRHRAAVGLSKDTDALVVVVSEESGAIRIAERGELSDPMDAAQFRDELTRRLHQEPPVRDAQTAEEAAAEASVMEPAPTEEPESREHAA